MFSTLTRGLPDVCQVHLGGRNASRLCLPRSCKTNWTRAATRETRNGHRDGFGCGNELTGVERNQFGGVMQWLIGTIFIKDDSCRGKEGASGHISDTIPFLTRWVSHEKTLTRFHPQLSL